LKGGDEILQNESNRKEENRQAKIADLIWQSFELKEILLLKSMVFYA